MWTSGRWSFRSDNLTVELDGSGPGRGYCIDLERMRSSAEVLDWISQVTEKSWATAEDIGALVRMINAWLPLQSNVCGYGKDHRIDPA